MTSHDETLDGTTRTYSRTTWQCFPSERAHCIEGPQRKPGKVADVFVAIALVAILVLIGLNSVGVLK